MTQPTPNHADTFPVRRGRNRVATILAFALLVVIGRQFTPQSSSAAEANIAGEIRPDWLREAPPTPPQHAGGFYLECGPTGGAPYTVRNTAGQVVADGLTSGQVMARFPDLRLPANGDPFGLGR